MDRPFSIVVAFDFSQTSELACAEAFEIAEARAPCRLTVLNIGAPEGDDVRIELDDRVATMSEASAQALLKVHVARVRTPDAKTIETVYEIRRGSPGEEIVRSAAQNDADLLVLGTHGRRGLKRALLGSVAEFVVRHAGCPVLVVRQKDHEEATERETDPLIKGSALL